jgi:FkbM family methyltransferase
MGANRGDFTERLLDAFPEAVVIAFEPATELCSDLQRRFTTESRLVVENIALWREICELPFYRHADSGTSSFFPRNREGRRYYSKGDQVIETHSAKTATLDLYSNEHNRKRYRLLKLDAQGSELAILEGASGLLSASAIDVIYVEFFVVPHYDSTPLLPDIWRLLRQHRYDMYDLFKGPHGRNGQLRFGDAISSAHPFGPVTWTRHPRNPNDSGKVATDEPLRRHFAAEDNLLANQ